MKKLLILPLVLIFFYLISCDNSPNTLEPALNTEKDMLSSDQELFLGNPFDDIPDDIPADIRAKIKASWEEAMNGDSVDMTKYEIESWPDPADRIPGYSYSSLGHGTGSDIKVFYFAIPPGVCGPVIPNERYGYAGGFVCNRSLEDWMRAWADSVWKRPSYYNINAYAWTDSLWKMPSFKEP